MRNFRDCSHEYIWQTKKGIPSLLPFVCKYCGLGSWYSTVEEEDAAREAFMEKLTAGLRQTTDPIFDDVKKFLGVT